MELAGGSPSQIEYQDADRFVYPVKDASFEKAKRDLGWEARITLEDGIRRTIEWQRRTLGL